MGRLKTFAFRRGYYPLDLLRVRLACKRNNIEDESQMQYNKDRYKRGAHTVLDIQFHFVWKTKYGYPVLRGEVGLRLRDLLKRICS